MIVWGVSQLEVVKIIVVVDNIASLESDPETETTTFVMCCADKLLTSFCLQDRE